MSDTPTEALVTAVVPVYGDGAHLAELLDSLEAQTIPVEIRVVSSKCGPNAQRELDERGLVVVHHEGGSIGRDWNRAIEEAETPMVFIAHQDDRYAPEYAATLSALLDADPSAAVAWCDYRVINGNSEPGSQVLPVIKRVMTEAFSAGRTVLRSSVAKRWINAVGPVIGCPTVMFRSRVVQNSFFDEELQVNLDWDAWWRLGEMSVQFARSREKLVDIRVHGSAESAKGKATGVRAREDLALLERYWPAPVARLLQRIVKLAY